MAITLCNGIMIKPRAVVHGFGMVDVREIATALTLKANARQHVLEDRSLTPPSGPPFPHPQVS